MKNKKHVVLNESVPAGWYDDDLEVKMMFSVDCWEGGHEAEKFDTLAFDNRGRFFLLNKGEGLMWKVNWQDLPGTAFHEVSVREACEWAVRAVDKSTDSSGVLSRLIEATLDFLPQKKKGQSDAPWIYAGNA